MSTSIRVLASVFVLLLGCGDDSATSGQGGSGGADSGGAGGTGVGGESCDEPGKPEMTGPITGLDVSYVAGDPIDIGVPVDEDTKRVIVGVYEVGTTLYLGGTAEDTTGAATMPLSLFAGVADGETGTFYLSIELCSTSVCTTPFIRNTYQRADRTAPTLETGETYDQTREFVGEAAMPVTCPSSIPIQSFTIE